MPNGLVIGTFLPPTRGHRQLVQFALDYMRTEADGNPYAYFVNLMVSSRSREPMKGIDRLGFFEKEFQWDKKLLTSLHEDDNAPQNPKSDDDPEFWDYWVKTIRTLTNNKPGDIVFASETYGAKLAEVLECKFVPYNIYRETVDISGTKVRENPIENFHMIMPSVQKELRKTITVFGAESTGKTTMTNWLAQNCHGHFLPEWAREYLENMPDHTVTDEKMEVIMKGQFASQLAAKHLENKPFIFQDTDLLSTIGYYRIYKGEEPTRIRELFNKTKSDLYIVMNSNIPFTEDKLRYGGAVRESSDQFWIDLLEEFDCKYVRIESVTRTLQRLDARQAIKEFFMSNPLYSFKRD